MQFILGDIVLMKLDAFQGKCKVKDQRSETEYKGRNVKTVHCNQPFLVATLRGDVTPLGGNESSSDKGATQSTLAELTSLEWEIETSEGTLDEALT